MKLRNKKTREIGTLIVDGAYKFVTNFAVEDDEMNRLGEYNSLAELNEEWEDYEEPREYWFINSCGVIEVRTEEEQLAVADMHKQFGNYFEFKEEAEEAVEKLKAWKRLKNKGFRFTGFEETDRGCLGDFTIYCYMKPDYTRPYDDVKDDLDLLFGGEE